MVMVFLPLNYNHSTYESVHPAAGHGGTSFLYQPRKIDMNCINGTVFMMSKFDHWVVELTYSNHPVVEV